MKRKKSQGRKEPLAECVTEQTPLTFAMRKRERKFKQQKLYLLMLVTLALLLLTAVLFLAIPLFDVDEIIVEGNSYYSAEEVISATGIRVGDEIVTVFFSDLDEKAFYTSCPYIRSVTVTCGLSKVWIRVDEVKDLMYAADAEGNWCAFSPDLRVWQKADRPIEFEEFLRVRLPAFYPVEKGGVITFENQSLTYDYIWELIDALKAANVLSTVSYIDFSDKFSVCCIFGDRIRLELGAVSDMERKFAQLAQVLAEREDSGCAVIDVSNSERTLYRAISYIDLYP